MKRVYIITVDAKAAHQPTSDEIFAEVKKLVDRRVSQFPKNGGGSHEVGIVPKRDEWTS